MITASKGPTPRCLIALAATPGATWDSVHSDQKAEIRKGLARDQGTLCAYCQRRSPPAEGSMRIDHWHSRSDGGAQFEWSNLVGSCASSQTCDIHKANARLFLHPYRAPAPRDLLRYTRDGRAQSDDTRVEDDIKALNLNAPELVRARKAALDALIEDLNKHEFRRPTLRARLRGFEILSGAVAPEHAGVLAARIRQWIRRIP